MALSRFRVTLLAFILTCIAALPLPIPRVDDERPLQPPSASVSSKVPIVLLHMYDSISFFARLGRLTGENKARYAARQGYELVQSTPGNTSGILKEAPCGGRTADDSGRCWQVDKEFDIDHSRAATFGKFKLAVAACHGRENGWLLWTDADAMIVNQSVPLESIIDDGYDIILAYDWLMLNAGVLLLKCSSWNLEFMTNVYNAREFDKARALDQSSFQKHLDDLDPSVRDQHVKVIPKYAMNVYTEEYRPGDFILHMAGKLYEATEPGIYAIATQYDVLSMVDDVEDITAFFRGRRLLNYYSGTCAINRGEKQKECKPDDNRRILLNESLGSMSYPNRYRHVGLRYYWLGDWKDKYDVPDWDVKRKQLPVQKHVLDDRQPMPPAPLSHHTEGREDDNVPIPHLGRDDDMKEADRKDADADEEDDEDALAERQKLQDNPNADETDDDLENDGSWSFLTWILVGLSVIAAIGSVVLILRRRRKLFSKIH